MDNTEARAAVIKQSRRELLRALNIMYAIGPFAFDGLCIALTHLELPDDECVKRDLIYLVDKGYVTWTNERRAMPWNERLYRLTARGNEIANEIDRDPALEP